MPKLLLYMGVSLWLLVFVVAPLPVFIVTLIALAIITQEKRNAVR